MSWVISKSIPNNLDVKYDNYLHMLIQQKQSNVSEKQLQKNES